MYGKTLRCWKAKRNERVSFESNRGHLLAKSVQLNEYCKCPHFNKQLNQISVKLIKTARSWSVGARNLCQGGGFLWWDTKYYANYGWVRIVPYYRTVSTGKRLHDECFFPLGESLDTWENKWLLYSLAWYLFFVRSVKEKRWLRGFIVLA